MTDRFANLFNALKAQKDGALVPFVNLCDPTPEKSLEILETLTEAGADAFELGIPFSDPSADGPVICLSSKRALANGSDTQKCLQVVQQYRAKHPDMPISLMIYINLAYAPGLDHFFAQCHEAGVDAVLIPDIPSSMRARESEWDTAARAHDVQLISLVPPNADADKIRRISQHSEGYIYLMSRSGVTGTDRAAGMPTHHVVELMKDRLPYSVSASASPNMSPKQWLTVLTALSSARPTCASSMKISMTTKASNPNSPFSPNK